MLGLAFGRIGMMTLNKRYESVITHTFRRGFQPRAFFQEPPDGDVVLKLAVKRPVRHLRKEEATAPADQAASVAGGCNACCLGVSMDSFQPADMVHDGATSTFQ